MLTSRHRWADIVFLALGCALLGAMAYFSIYLGAIIRNRPRAAEPTPDRPAAVYHLSLPESVQGSN